MSARLRAPLTVMPRMRHRNHNLRSVAAHAIKLFDEAEIDGGFGAQMFEDMEQQHFLDTVGPLP